ncbi:MAG: AAA family ATPase [Nostoc sp. LLA-1]|nr:AAA family ATPase [Cyanocohniella sp. LLY]
MTISGYSITERLYAGIRTLVYRCNRESDQKSVVIKLMRNEYPTFGEIVQFRNQYTITKNLDIPGIIKPISLEPYRNGYALVMEDFGGISLKEWRMGNEKFSMSDFLNIAIAITTTLEALHQHQVIHKDIKPANILIHPETKQIKLIDFSIASLLPRETPQLQNTNVLEGTLSYISPEQTGRMNRGIDYRTDFYSLGITFYEIFTEKLPFSSNDPMELVHAHLAKIPPSVHNINPNIPPIISEIIAKLMAKNAEDRYQSAAGLKHDLEICLSELQITDTITDFTLASRDITDRFLIPEKLYGREQEVETLLQAFERVADGNSEIMLVSGFSGIGKTVVVNEVHKPIVGQRGYFIKGKFDQFQKSIPFSAFVQAFRGLMWQLLGESDSQIQQWKTKILNTVGENGQAIIEVIPELAKIIGEQPPVAELLGTAAQNRFNLLFWKFVQVFTTKEHPLVIFLDDLQWADSASLKLIQLLMSEANSAYMLIIGAYRDNEVFPAHPLMLTLEEISKIGATVNTITLQPLSECKLNQLVADTLGCSETVSCPLAQFVYQKTAGNPFFATQFLKALYQKNLINFNFAASCWECDISQINQLTITDDVVIFMTFQLQNLPRSSQDVLQLAACIGNQFDLSTLAVISEQSEIETASCLWKALQEGLILPTNEVYKFFIQDTDDDQLVSNKHQSLINNVTYKFLHDRVQQAAYSLIPDEQKQATHLKIGKLLLENTANDAWEEKIFDIVNQLNIGRNLIIQSGERDKLVELNLQSASKAKAATAYGAAIDYLTIGINLLPKDSWNSQYELTHMLYEEAAEVAYLNTNYQQMEEFAGVILQRTHSLIEKIRIYEIKMLAAKAKNQLLTAIQIGLQVLQLLGVEFPEQPTPGDIGQALEQTLLAWKDVSIPSLVDLEIITDPIKLATMRILTQMVPSAYQVAPMLLPLLIFQQINISITYGNCAVSAFAYADYGLVLCGVVGNLDAGYQFGRLALNILEHFQILRCKCRTYFVVYGYISHWQEPLKNVLPFFQEGYQVGLETGDLESSALNAHIYCCYAYFAGDELTALASEMEIYRQGILQIKQTPALNFHLIYQQTVLNLLGRADDLSQLVGEVYNETQSLPQLQVTNNYSCLYYLYYNKMVLCYLFGQYEQASAYAALVEESYADSMLGMFVITLFNFYSSLVYLALCSSATELAQTEYLEKVAANQEKLKKWSDYAPINHLHKFYLVKAEYNRILGNKSEAIEDYDRAIFLAQEHKYIQEEALAHELAAKFYLAWGKEAIAQSYMTNAYYVYTRWGSSAKVNDLEQRYPQLLASILQQQQQSLTLTETIFAASSQTSKGSSSGSSSISEALDLATIFKASQTLSSEIELEKLLSALLRVVQESAGADKCVLLMPKDDQWVIEALSQIGQPDMILCSLPIENSQSVPVSLIQMVRNTLKPSVIGNAGVHLYLAVDPYILHHSPKSVLCTPILHQGKLIGILYLENNLTVGAFTSDRLEILHLLCTQAAISLENARIYQQTQIYAQDLQESLEALRVSEARFKKFADNIPGVIYQLRTTADGHASTPYVSSGCNHLYGVKVQELISGNKSLRDFEHPDDNLEINQAMFSAAQNLMPFRHEWRIITASGQEKWVQVAAQPELQENGDLLWDGVVLDISDRKRAEAERQKKAEELKFTLQELQQTQIQLVQNEKMSALGNLVAGVAHEMNNPLGFIAASLKQTKPTLDDVITHLKLYQETFNNPGDEILDHAEEIDLDYTLEDLPKVIDTMEIACDRLKNISTSLRTFSRADKDYKVLFQIHKGIDSTILILKHRLKANEHRPEIEVITKYGDLPEIECFPGQLNQVFMNILANAIDVLEESNIGLSFAEIKANPNQITITTSLENNHIKIIIADNGQGMTEEVRKQVFEHLFTTKTVGKGTGLGLAIARQIVVEKHGGNIEVVSELGKGAEFIICIPWTAGN